MREEEEANRRRIGFMAQDIQKVLPELVQTDEKGVMSIDYIGFIPLIVESLKQMQQTIQDQQKEIETLQSLLPAETKSMFRSTSNEDVSVVEERNYITGQELPFLIRCRQLIIPPI